MVGKMPNLPRPRLRRTRVGELVAPLPPEPDKPHVEEVAAEGLRWVNIDRMGPLEQAWLEENFDFHALDFEDVLSRNQRPKIDVYDDYLFIVLHFPIFDRAARRLGAGELDVFVGPGFLITIPNQPLQPVEYLFERCRQKEEIREQLFSRGSGYLLYRLVDDGFDYCFPMLRKIGNKLDVLEEEIFEGSRLARDRPRHLQRQAGDHQLPQGDPPAASRPSRSRDASSSATCRRTWTSRSTSTTSSTRTSGSGTCSRTTRRSRRPWSSRTRR